MVIGFSFRAKGHFNPYIFRDFLINQIFIVTPHMDSISPQVLAPIFFLAINYVIFGRLLRSTLALDDIVNGRKLSFLNPRRISLIFLGSDIASFLIQANGSGLAASDNDSTTRIGLNILLAGMALNFASFIIFISLVVYFDRATGEPYYDARMSRRFEPVIRALYTSWIFIMVPVLVWTSLIRFARCFGLLSLQQDGPVQSTRMRNSFTSSMLPWCYSPRLQSLISGSQQQEFSSSSSLQDTES